MNKYMIREGLRGLYYLGEDGEMDVQDYTPSRINYMYVADHDGKLTYIKRDGNKTEFDVKKGDLVLEFYSGYDFPNQCIVVQSDLWKENIESSKEAALKRAEQYAKTKCEDCSQCENCAIGSNNKQIKL